MPRLPPAVPSRLLMRSKNSTKPFDDFSLAQDRDGLIVGLAFGFARIGKLEQHDPDVAERTAAATHQQFGGRRQAHGADKSGLGVEFEAVAHLVGKDAGDFVGPLGCLQEAACQDDIFARRGEGVDETPVDDDDLEGTVCMRLRRQPFGEFL